MSVARFLMLLALVVWVGGIIFFAFVVAPAVFSVLPTRQLAGSVVQRSLSSLHWIGIVCGGVFLIASAFNSYSATGTPQPSALRNLLVLGMMALTFVSQTVGAAKMDTLRAAMGEIDKVPVDDVRRVAFNNLHQWSTRIEVVVLLLGLATLYFIAREWSVPAMNRRNAQVLTMPSPGRSARV